MDFSMCRHFSEIKQTEWVCKRARALGRAIQMCKCIFASSQILMGNGMKAHGNPLSIFTWHFCIAPFHWARKIALRSTDKLTKTENKSLSAVCCVYICTDVYPHLPCITTHNHLHYSEKLTYLSNKHTRKIVDDRTRHSIIQSYIIKVNTTRMAAYVYPAPFV